MMYSASKSICHLTPRYLRTKVSRFTTSLRTPSISNNNTEVTTTTVRSFEDIPGPKGLPIIGNTLSIIFDKNQANYLKLFPEMYQKHGKIFRADIGPQKVVAICKPELVEELFRQEDKFPIRHTPVTWENRNKEREFNNGLSAVGEEWFRARRLFNEKLLRPKEIDVYVPQMNEVVTNFLEIIETMKDKDGIISDLRSELFGWSLEMMGTVALGTRLGAIGQNKSSESVKFVKAVREAIQLLFAPEMLAYPEWLIKIYKTKNVKQYERCIDVSIDYTIKCVKEKMRDLERNDGESNDPGVDMITYMLGRKELSLQDIVSNIQTLLFAAVDTTSHATQWALYCLASNPEIQERLHQELQREVGPGHIPTAENINRVSYLKCFMKETQRMYPPATVFYRKPTKDIVLGGYKIPPEVWVAVAGHFLAHDPENFQDPEKFKPERWARDSEIKPAPFTLIPFGFGNRACLGRRVAELETKILLSRVCLNYKVEHVGEKPTFVLNPLLTSEKPIQLKYTRR